MAHTLTHVTVNDVKLHDETTIPQLGFGVWQVPDDQAQQAVEEALRVGYRMIDTAAIYGNEQGEGRALRASGLPRDEVYVTTKLWNADQGYDSAFSAYATSLDRLGLEKVDLYLIHWAAPAFGLYRDTWKALVKLHEEGRVGAIGVSNHHEDHLRHIIDDTGVTPVLNQIEQHPYLQQNHLRQVHQELGIVTQAWSPLGSGKGLLDDPVLGRIAEKHQVTPAQVTLAWHLAIGNVVIPKSVTPSRIAENFAATTVTLDAQDLADIEALDRGERTGGHPDHVDYGHPPHLKPD
ncbi:MAG TPA: aldo/keto reductase [Beutenbergiaceae bacterium]|nr:aldo/keto reductase [Beutenbergiaceae bacterium]